MSQTFEEALLEFKVEELAASLTDTTNRFRMFTENSRCYLCGDKIETERWQFGEYVSGNKEVVHTSCWEEEAERASSEGSYWCGSTTEEALKNHLLGENVFFSSIPFEKVEDSAYHYSRRGGEPSGEAEANAGARVSTGAPSETLSQVQGIGGHAGEHGGHGHQPDAQGQEQAGDDAGGRGPDKAGVSERLIPFVGFNDVTVRVPVFVKEELRTMVKGQEVITGDEFIVIDKIKKALNAKGVF